MRPVIENVYRYGRYSIILRETHESTDSAATSVDRRWLPDAAVNFAARLGHGRSHRRRRRETARIASGDEATPQPRPDRWVPGHRIWFGDDSARDRHRSRQDDL